MADHLLDHIEWLEMQVAGLKTANKALEERVAAKQAMIEKWEELFDQIPISDESARDMIEYLRKRDSIYENMRNPTPEENAEIEAIHSKSLRPLRLKHIVPPDVYLN